MRPIIALIILSFPYFNFAQQILTLDQCYLLAEKASPLANNRSLLATQNQQEVAALQTAKKPQFEVSAKATYQSDVTEVPIDIPGFSIETVSLDQYNASLTATQLLYDGGRVNASVRAKETELASRQQKVEVSLYELKSRINRHFFTVLMMQEKGKLLKSKKEWLEARSKETQAGLTHGVVDKSAVKLIEVELLRLDQQIAQTEKDRKTHLQSLYTLIGISDADKDIVLETTWAELKDTPTGQRPEMKLLSLKQAELNAGIEKLSTENQPKLAAFGTGGYGKPGLNMLKNEFQGYYMFGVNVKWTPFDWQANKKKRESLAVQKAMLEQEKQNLARNIQLESKRLADEMDNISQQMDIDQSIIAAREEILAIRKSQLENGILRPAEYLDAITDLFDAKITLSRHRIEWILAKTNYQITKGY